MLMSNPLGKYEGKGIGGSDEKKRIDSKLSYSFEDLFKKLEWCIDWYEHKSRGNSICLDEVIRKEVKNVLSPIEINNFLINSDNKIKDKETLGLFLSQLVKNSFRKGQNDFAFNPLKGLEYINFKGKKERPINVKIYGDSAGDLRVKYAKLEVLGNLVDLSIYEPSHHSTILVDGDVMSLGAESHHMVISVLGALREVPSARDSLYYIEEFSSPNEHSGSPTRCAFLTKNKRTYDALIEEFIKYEVPKSGNKIILQDKKGKIIEAKNDA